MSNKFTPRCKPFRIAELVGLVILFIMLFFLRKSEPGVYSIVDANLILFLFTSFSTFLILIAADVLCQSIKHPISNIPMMEVLILGAVFCFIAGIFTLVVRATHVSAQIIPNALSLIVFMSFLITILFILDAIILTKFA